MPKRPTKTPRKKDQTPMVRDLVALIRAHKPTYYTFNNACYIARQVCELHGKPGKSLPKLLTGEEFKRYMAHVVNSENLQHEIMLKLLFYTGVRNEELTFMKVSDIDMAACKIFIDDGKGGKDRYVLFLDTFKSLLRAYIATLPDNQTYLFESQQHGQYTTRRIHQIVSQYGKECTPPIHAHPHKMRHHCFTELKKGGMDDAQVQLVSGHSSRASLEVYTHLTLNDTAGDYQETMRKVQMP